MRVMVDAGSLRPAAHTKPQTSGGKTAQHGTRTAAQHGTHNTAHKSTALVDTALGKDPVAAGRALRQLDHENGSRQATDHQVAHARTAAALPNPLQGLASFAGEVFDGALTAASKVAPGLGKVVDGAGQVGHDVIDRVGKPFGPAASAIADAVETTGDVGRIAIEEAGGVALQVARAGSLNVARDVSHTVKSAVDRIVAEAGKHPGDPGGFLDWLSGPAGPSFEDLTAKVPGLQRGIGNLIDRAMDNPAVSGAIGTVFGFQYQPGVDFYTTGELSIQSMLGFHDMYDSVGKLLGMDLDDKVMEFTADGVEYRVELWKGGYGNGGAFGGEIGIYTRGTGERGPLGDLLELIPGYYSSANGDSQIRMTQQIYNKETGEPYFTNPGLGADGGPAGDHFWNLAIRTDPGVRHEDLGQRGTLEMDSVAAAKALCAEMNRQGAKDGSLTAEIQGTTVSYVWE